eukprot:TRINITY_DN9730_c0_g1_i2.p1 TRINITY_DN9730_c0_g1~~TRINITY_DN9730_c0_g1_i2.p1  ORF type:complete len:144 (+),score=20.15 TRINITY_DN9730_c0_g1_i2:60-434(+)
MCIRDRYQRRVHGDQISVLIEIANLIIEVPRSDSSNVQAFTFHTFKFTVVLVKSDSSKQDPGVTTDKSNKLDNTTHANDKTTGSNHSTEHGNGHTNQNNPHAAEHGGKNANHNNTVKTGMKKSL